MILRLELKKILTSPIVIGLMVFFIGFNIFIIYSSAPPKEDVRLLNKVIDEYGTLMDGEARGKLKLSYESGLASWNEKNGTEFKDLSEFFKQMGANPDAFPEKEMEKMVELSVQKSLFSTAEGLEGQYNHLDLLKNAETQIKLYGFSGKAAETIREQYKSLEPRLEEIIKGQEHLHLFHPGTIFRTHSLVFKTLFGLMIFEAMILVVLFTAFLAHYERDQGSDLVAFSTRRGRRLMWDKLISALLASFILTLLLMVGTLGSYFFAVDYSRLWTVPISTGFMIEPDGNPFISWWKLTFIEYLLLGLGLVLILQLLFTLITFVLSIWVRNSYFVFIIFAVAFGLGLLLPGKMPMDSNLSLYTVFNPASLVLGVKKWWMESGAFTTFKYFEVITVSLWLSIFILAAWFSMKRFYQQNL
jgi:hypothetical protein